jgi:hypothetical protein
MRSTPSGSSAPGRVRRFLELPLHPFLFATYAVLFLWSQNVSKVRPADVVAPLAMVLVGTAVLFAIGWLVLRRSRRAALLLTALLLLFFGYRHVFGPSGNDRVGLAIWLVLAVAAVVAVVVAKPEGRRASYVINAVLIVLVLMSGFTILTGKLSEWREGAAAATATDPVDGGSSAAPATAGSGQKRDIFFILLDRYAGEKTLRQFYDYDNSSFLEGLRSRGFYVASGSRGPYPKTPHSIQTTLNMEYIDLPADSGDWKKVYGRLRAPKTARFLKERGYKYVLMGSGYHSLRRDPFADLNVTYDPKSGPVFSEFTNVLYNSTVLAAIGERYDVAILDYRRQWYERALFQFRQLPRIAKMPEPTYTFAHILVNHEPFVFHTDGTYQSAAEEEKKTKAQVYRESIEYAGKKTLDVIDELLSGPPETDPIIVLQSDEGPGPKRWRPSVPGHYDWTKAPQQVLEEKFRILNAYYLPGLEDPGLYQTIGPANSFRLVFNKYFNAGLPMLPDRSYVFRNELEPYAFIDVTERVKD